jgi:3D (Asp-Asp-Asp) domain-containing protein
MGIKYRGGTAFNPDGSIIDGVSSVRSVPTTQSATPSINSDVTAYTSITGLAQAITGITVTGTPEDGQKLGIAFTDNGTARAIAFGSQFEASGTVTLPTTTVLGVRLDCEFVYNAVTSKWRILYKS